MNNKVIKETDILTSRMDTLLSRIERINERLISAKAPLIQIEILGESMSKVRSGAASGLASMTRVRVKRDIESENGNIHILAVSQLNNSNDGFQTHRFFRELSEKEIEMVNNPPHSPNFCDHCKTVRIRSKMYTVQLKDKVSRVGTSCLDEFSGVKMNRWAKAIDEADNLLEQFSILDYSELQRNLSVSVDSLLEEALKEIETKQYDDLPTPEFNMNVSSAALIRARARLEEDNSEPTPSHIKDKVKQVKEFILNTDIDPQKRSIDYFLNLRNLVRHGYVTSKESNLLVSSISSMMREIQREKELEKSKDIGNKFIGELKERRPFKNLTIDSSYIKEGQYGYTTDFKFIDDENNYYSWKASGLFNLEKGDKVHLVGTIVGHETWDSKKYGKIMFDNKLSRCKIMSEPDIDQHIEKESKKKSKKKSASTPEP